MTANTDRISSTDLDIKKQLYTALVKKRKACRTCLGLTNPSIVNDGNYDSNEIGPWSNWQGSLDAEVVVVGQDFSAVPYFLKHQGKDNSKNQTNVRLARFLNELGFSIKPGTQSKSKRLFFTNAILCLKASERGPDSRIQKAWVENCGNHFLRPLIELISPRVVITLGECALASIQKAYGLPILPLSESIVGREGHTLSPRTRLFPVYHLSRLVSNSRTRTEEEQEADWNRIAIFLNNGASPETASQKPRAAHQGESAKCSELSIKNSILAWLRWQRGVMAWPNDSVGIFDPTRNVFRKKRGQYHLNGVADILGIWKGRPLAIEVKSPTGKLTREQNMFLKNFRQHGGIALVAHSVEDLINQLKLET